MKKTVTKRQCYLQQWFYVFSPTPYHLFAQYVLISNSSH